VCFGVNPGGGHLVILWGALSNTIGGGGAGNFDLLYNEKLA